MTEDHIERLIAAIDRLGERLDGVEEQLASIAANIEAHSELLEKLSYIASPGSVDENRVLRVSTDY
jgi:hypothetical protein